MNSHSALLTLFEARAVVYEVLARGFQGNLSSSMPSVLASSDFSRVCTVIDDEQGNVSAALSAAVVLATNFDTEEFAQQYETCFGGLQPLVLPWESVYVTGERLVFQPCTLAVRDAYASCGFVAEGHGSEPDDHIATEFDFMNKLSKRAAHAFREGDGSVCSRSLAASKAFLAEHLGAWVHDFAHVLFDAGEDCSFYAALAHFAEALVESDRSLLVELEMAVAS